LETSKTSSALRWVAPALNIIYRVLVLAALVWIGVGVQDIANAVYAGGGETCAVDPEAGDSSNDNGQPGIIKPLLRGTM
jgi:hypothetical protein